MVECGMKTGYHSLRIIKIKKYKLKFYTAFECFMTYVVTVMCP